MALLLLQVSSPRKEELTLHSGKSYKYLWLPVHGILDIFDIMGICTGFSLSHFILSVVHRELHSRTPQGAGYGVVPSSAKPDGFVTHNCRREI